MYMYPAGNVSRYFSQKLKMHVFTHSYLARFN